MFPPSILVSLVLFKVLAEHFTGQFRLPILMAPCQMETSWLATILNLLEGIPHQCPIIKDLVMDVSMDQVLKGLPLLQLTLWLRDVCCAERFSHHYSVRQWQELLENL